VELGKAGRRNGSSNRYGDGSMIGGVQYIDGIGNVSVVNGMAHINLVVVRPPSAEGQQPQIETVQHLVMPLPNFVRLCAEMAGHLQRMEQKGLITRREPT
jgi:hypothetical protein